MNPVRNIHRRLINALFSDVEVFFGLPFKWKIRGALAIGCLYVALVIMLLIAFNPVQATETLSVGVIFAGYAFLFIGIVIVILPVFIPSLQRYPLPVVILSVLVLMAGFNITLQPMAGSVDNITLIALFTGFLAITFGARLYGRVVKEVSTEKTRIDTEIRLAQKIQNDLLPVIDMDEEEFQAFGKTVNAQEIGGDFFLCYSDGIVELRDRSGEEFGYQRLLGLLNRLNPANEPRPAYDNIRRSIEQFYPGEQRRDDITLLIIKIK